MVNLNLLGERAVPYFTATLAFQRQTANCQSFPLELIFPFPNSQLAVMTIY